MTYLSTGELAKRLDVSVRTLRYYDQIGLVQPTERGNGGKRLYSEDDIFMLEKILLLKDLSLSLEDSKKVIQEQSMATILSAHRASLTEKVETLNESIRHTTSLIHALELEGKINWQDVLRLVVDYKEEKNWAFYFTDEEQQLLETKLPSLENQDTSTKKWMNLIKRIELCMEKGASPESEEAQIIVDDLNILSEETFHGDQELMEKFWEVRKSERASADLRLYPIREEIISFIEQALAVQQV
ncbi:MULTISPECIES: MerR family transcriptional regulator [unclassified Sporosarcina]|uniref:MerR family transcriptional regulator n=1 Tax=unclassified Sporosarcina TaxID=2647733 RepID=UPI00203D20EA|nr:MULTISPECIES: MerR family transcriptional regulator [unclassified Sporosarcina]GKV64694.1 MerR family transcriptional regulator [Sporosarcina sp. NCCP-2331]GLB54804.1 MerR family transcriptional regulator [Sporosarcina sp. NCCP-2378]